MPIPPNWHPWKAEPERTFPEVWAGPSTGLEWCDCGCHDPLTYGIVREFARDLYGLILPDRMTHTEVVLVAMLVWNYTDICRVFLLAVDAAAIRVNGTLTTDYPLGTGLAIVKAFSDRWNGCDEERAERAQDSAQTQER
jgi:hypothetical protein